jgi:hypothetical protein
VLDITTSDHQEVAQRRFGDAAIEMPPLVGSTIDPRLTSVAWAAWRVTVPPGLNDLLGMRPFGDLAEAMWDPEQPAVLVSQLEGSGSGKVVASVALGVFGASDVERERDAAARCLARDMAALRVGVEPLAAPQALRPTWAMTIRPVTLSIGGCAVPSRFTKFANVFTLLSTVLRHLPDAVTVRISHLTTSLTEREKATLESLRATGPEFTIGARTISPAVTAADLCGRLSGAVFEREVLVAGSGGMPAQVDLRRIACALTSTLTNVWTANGAEASNDEIAQGGFVIEHEDPRVMNTATGLGLPGTVLDGERRIADLVPLDGLLWGIPCPNDTVPGLSSLG